MMADSGSPTTSGTGITFTQTSIDGAINIESTLLSDVGSYSLIVETFVEAPAGSFVTFATTGVFINVQNLPFDVTASCTSMVLSSNQSDSVTYTIGDNPVTIPMPTYTGSPIGCILDLNYELVLEAKIPDQNFTSTTSTAGVLPSFVTFDKTTGITVNGLNYSESWATYQFRLIATDMSPMGF